MSRERDVVLVTRAFDMTRLGQVYRSGKIGGFPISQVGRCLGDHKMSRMNAVGWAHITRCV